MKIGDFTRFLKKGLGTVLAPVIKPTEALVGTMVKNLLIKFLSSLLKNVIGLLIAGLVAFTSVPLPEGTDHTTLIIWGAVVAGAGALISLLKRWLTFDPSKIKL